MKLSGVPGWLFFLLEGRSSVGSESAEGNAAHGLPREKVPCGGAVAGSVVEIKLVA